MIKRLLLLSSLCVLLVVQTAEAFIDLRGYPSSPNFAGTITAGSSATVLTDSTGLILSAALNTVAVAQGGTSATTLTSNGVLYGNGTGAVQATAQGPANSILTANAAAPSFSAAPTIGTSVTTPIMYGGTAVGSTLTIRGTSNGSPSNAYILLNPSSEGNVGIGNTTAPTKPLTISTPSGTESSLRLNQVSQNFWDFKSVANTTRLDIGSITTATVITLQDNGNVGIGTTAFGTSAAGGVLAMANATAPTTSPASITQLWSANVAGVGTAGLNLRGEVGDVWSFGNNRLGLPAFTFANIATYLTANGQVGYCSDCTIANPCATAGTGAIAKRLNGVNVCN